MTYEKNAADRLYKALLKLYPRAFQERLGESMQQTFKDLYQERQTESASYGVLLWTFAETGVAIFREHVLSIVEGAAMRTMVSNPRLAPLISFVLCVLPFMVLEWATQSSAPRSDASPMLWVVLWLLSTIWIALLMTSIRYLRQAETMMTIPTSLWFRFVMVVIAAWLWGALVIDQMPCFLGGSGC